MRKALVVGVDFYPHVGHLYGCVDDAHSLRTVLERHSDGSVNFGVELLTGTGAGDVVTRNDLKDKVQELFADDVDIALFYFAGHGHTETAAGYLLASDSTRADEGLTMGELFGFANKSPAKNRVILLDSCHSGAAGIAQQNIQFSEIKEGTTILTACTAEQYAKEGAGGGVFTGLLADALNGAAGNLLGAVTPGSVYAHIDQSLGPWDQRPVFKTSVKSFVSLRTVQAPISLGELQRITEFFPSPGFEFQLAPTYESERSPGDTSTPPPNPDHVAKFQILQRYNRVNLVVPVDAPHMWHAAMQGKSCKLTVLGEHYRRLREKGRI